MSPFFFIRSYNIIGPLTTFDIGPAVDFAVTHIEEDKYRPGFVLFSQGHALKTSDGVTTQVIAGSPAQFGSYGYREGKGTSARFYLINGFYQITPSLVIVVDNGNCCLRQVDRRTNMTSTYIGACGRDHCAYQDGRGTSVKFRYP